MLIEGLNQLAERYDGFIVDLWGVMHDGVAAFPAALACLSALRARDRKIAILSNAPRRADSVAARNLELGITATHFDAVLSSGEETWQHLKHRPDAWYQALGSRCFHLGPQRDKGMLKGLDYDVVARVEDADFILNTGADRSSDEIATYQGLLDRALAAGLPMVCANPDLVVVRGGRKEICAGAIAEHYRSMGGEVRFHGKPNGSVYRTCLELLGLDASARMLAIGDSLRTDIAGATGVGFDSLFVLSGIHGDALGLGHAGTSAALADGVSPERLEALYRDYGLTSATKPTACIRALAW